jgi:hypothetical protein
MYAVQNKRNLRFLQVKCTNDARSGVVSARNEEPVVASA